MQNRRRLLNALNKPVLKQKEFRKLKLVKKQPIEAKLATTRNEIENTSEFKQALTRQKSVVQRNEAQHQSKLSVSVEVHGNKTPTKTKIPLQDSFSTRGKDPIEHARRVLSNLPDRKKTVLKIATENFDLVKRLERVRSAI